MVIPRAPYPAVRNFRYSVEVIAGIAAHFLNEETDERKACVQAIKLLDAAADVARGTMIEEHIHGEADELLRQTPDGLPFEKGVRWITGKRTQTDAQKAFRDYLRRSDRLQKMGFPNGGYPLTNEQIGILLASLPDGPKKEEEDARINETIEKHRKHGFTRRELAGMKELLAFIQNGIVRPFINSKKGKKGGRPRKSKKGFGDATIREE